MPAEASRIGFITSEFRRVVSETASVATRYGSLARISDDPIQTWFDNTDHAQERADARQALLSPERRRFRPVVVGASDAMALDYTAGVPITRYIDAERSFNDLALIGEINVDLARQQSTFTIWG